MLTLNGKPVLLTHKTLADFLHFHDFDLTCIAVELNGHIIQRSAYQKTILEAEDRLEVVSFVGGG